MLDFKLYIVSYSNCTLGDKNYNMQIIIHADCIVSECNKNEFSVCRVVENTFALNLKKKNLN